MGDRQLLLLAIIAGHIKGSLPNEHNARFLGYQFTDLSESWDNGQPRWIPDRRDPSGHPGGPPDVFGNGLPGHPSSCAPGFLSDGPPGSPKGGPDGFPRGCPPGLPDDDPTGYPNRCHPGLHRPPSPLG